MTSESEGGRRADAVLHDAGFRRHHCHCTYCRSVGASWRRRRTRLRAYDQWPGWQPTEPVRAHLRALIAAGTSQSQISRDTGVSVDAVQKIAAGRTERVTVRVSQALLAAKPSVRFVSIVGPRRRARALARIGYSLTEQARMLGVHQKTYTDLGRVEQWPAARATALASLYSRLAFAPPPAGPAADASRLNAERSGWASPAAWDDDTVDDPLAQPVGMVKRRSRPGRNPDPEPDLEAVDEVLAGRRRWSTLNDADRNRLITRCLDNGWTQTKIQNRLGLSGTTVAALLERIRPATPKPPEAIAA